jgi:hypothetical protein
MPSPAIQNARLISRSAQVATVVVANIVYLMLPAMMFLAERHTVNPDYLILSPYVQILETRDISKPAPNKIEVFYTDGTNQVKAKQYTPLLS